MVKVHFHMSVGHGFNLAHNAVSGRCHHRHHSSGFHHFGIELSVDFKNLFLEFGHLIGIDRAESISSFDGDIEFIAGHKTLDSFFKRHDHSGCHTEHQFFRIGIVGLVNQILGAVGGDFIKVVAEFNKLAWLNFSIIILFLFS